MLHYDENGKEMGINMDEQCNEKKYQEWPDEKYRNRDKKTVATQVERGGQVGDLKDDGKTGNTHIDRPGIEVGHRSMIAETR